MVISEILSPQLIEAIPAIIELTEWPMIETLERSKANNISSISFA